MLSVKDVRFTIEAAPGPVAAHSFRADTRYAGIISLPNSGDPARIPRYQIENYKRAALAMLWRALYGEVLQDLPELRLLCTVLDARSFTSSTEGARALDLVERIGAALTPGDPDPGPVDVVRPPDPVDVAAPARVIADALRSLDPRARRAAVRWALRSVEGP